MCVGGKGSKYVNRAVSVYCVCVCARARACVLVAKIVILTLMHVGLSHQSSL